MAKELNPLEKMYESIMKETSFDKGYLNPVNDMDRFKSVLHPDYSEYTTSTITGSLC